MRVNPNSDLVSVARITSQTGAQEPRLGADKLSFTSAETLNRALEQTPVTRTEKVAQAKSLVEDVTYPPPELIRRLAVLLSVSLDAKMGPDKRATA